MSLARCLTLLCSSVAIAFFLAAGPKAYAQPGGFAHFSGSVTEGTGLGEQAVGSSASLTIGTSGGSAMVMVKIGGSTIFLGSGPPYTPGEPYSDCVDSPPLSACIEIDEEGHGHVDVSDSQGNSVRIEF